MKNILKNTLGVLDRKERNQFYILAMLDIVINIVDILSLALLLVIIRFYIQPANNVLAFLPRWLADKNSALFIAVFVVLFGIKNWCGIAISRAHFQFISKIAIRISKNNLLNYQHAKFSEFIHVDSSTHIRNICFQPFEFSQYMLAGIQQIITQLSLILLTIIAIILFNAKLFLLLLLVLVPPVMIVFYFIKKKLTISKKNIQVSNEKSFQYLLDALKGYVESNIFNRNNFFLQRFVTSRQTFSTYLFDSLALQSMPGRIIEIFAVFGLFMLIVIAKWTGNNDGTALITIGAFMAAAYKIIPGIVKIINISGQMKAYEFSTIDLQPSHGIKDFSRPAAPVQDFKSIDFKNINFQYDGKKIFTNFSLSIKQGDFVGITGKSGIGKTSILNLLLGFLQPTNGEIYFNETRVNTDEIKMYWPLIAYVRQQNFFIYDTLLRNITLEEEGYHQKNLQDVLEVSGLAKIIKEFPEGLEKIITENGKNISGGQQQRIAIARALYKDTRLILLDEPFNELDQEATKSLLEHFRELSLAGKSIVMITHDKKSLSYCNKIISLDES